METDQTHHGIGKSIAMRSTLLVPDNGSAAKVQVGRLQSRQKHRSAQDEVAALEYMIRCPNKNMRQLSIHSRSQGRVVEQQIFIDMSKLRMDGKGGQMLGCAYRKEEVGL